MRSPGFQWFVAWRYLMARPRRLSGAIMVFATLFAWSTISVVYATLLDPLTDEYIAAADPLPMWLPTVFSAFLCLAVVVFLSALARLVLRTSWPDARELAALGRSPGAGRLLTPRGWTGAAHLLQISLGRAPLFVLLGGLGALGALAVASFSVGTGESLAELPGLADQPSAWLSWPVLTAAGAAVLAILVALAARRRPLDRTLALRIAALAAAMIPVAAAHVYWWRIADYGIVELGREGLNVDFKTAVWLTIVGGVSGALFVLALILLVIRYFFTFFTTVSMGGVAIGTMALVITLSVMSGFETDLRGKILGSNAHVLITRHDETPFTGYKQVMERVAGTRGVVAVTPYLTSEVVIAGSSNYFNVVVKGIDPQTIARVTDLAEDLDDERALERIWPLADDGGIAGPPADAGPGGGDVGPSDPDAVDPAPPDLEVDTGQPPTDWSGSGAASPPGASAPPAGSTTEPVEEEMDPAPADLEVVEAPPVDWSGGATEAAPEPDGGPSTEPLLEAEGVIEGAGDLDEPEPGDEVGGRGHRLDDRDWMPPPARELDPDIAALPGALVGRELVKQINLYEGQEVKIISPLGQNTIAGQTPYIKPYRVAGMFYTGMYEYDLKRVYLELSTLQDFLDLPDAVTGIEIRVNDPEDTEPVLESLRRMLGPDYTVQDWKELNRSLFSALKLEKIAMFLVLAIIILVASFSIVGNLIMVVVEKAREIAVLKTLGASDIGVTRIFIVQGFFIGMVGTAIGVTLGLGACFLAERYGIGIPPDVYYIDRLPIHVEPTAVVLVAAAGLLISVAATIYPAQIAARLRPVQGLRYE